MNDIYFIKLINGDNVIARLLNDPASEELHIEYPLALSIDSTTASTYLVRWLPFFDQNESFIDASKVLLKHAITDKQMLEYYDEVSSKLGISYVDDNNPEEILDQNLEEELDELEMILESIKPKTVH